MSERRQLFLTNYVEGEANTMGNRADAVVDAAYQAHQGDGLTRDKVAAESMKTLLMSPRR